MSTGWVPHLSNHIIIPARTASAFSLATLLCDKRKFVIEQKPAGNEDAVSCEFAIKQYVLTLAFLRTE